MNTELTRRDALKLALASGALVLPVQLLAADDAARSPKLAQITPWLVVAPDDSITVYISQAEMGQGISTGMAQVLADEMEADWQRIRIDLSAPIGPAYRIRLIDYTGQFTGGSSSMTLLFEPLRRAGAAAREMLEEAAATGWQVPRSECEARNGSVVHRPSGRRQRFGTLAPAASRLAIPDRPALKSRKAWRYIGRPLDRLDAGPKVDGSAVFGIDVVVPDMLVATVKHCPRIGGRILGFNEAEVKSLPGVVALIPLEGQAVLVVAKSWWQALKAVTMLKLQVDPAPADAVSTQALRAQMQQRLARTDTGRIARDEGDTRGLVPGAPGVISATYELPYLAHATLEPPCCTVHMQGDRVEAWIPTQGQDVAREVLHQVLQVPIDRITLHSTYIGGGFGRKFVPDFVAQAAIAAKVTGRPVKLIWRREEDIQHDRYRPGFMVELAARTDSRGSPSALVARAAVQPLLGQVFAGWVRNGVDESSVEGLADLSYTLPALRVEQVDVDAPVPLGFLRSVGQSPNAFALESFIDELALRAKRDPLAMRKELLRHDRRGLAVLELVAQRSGWGGKVPAGRARGIAYRGYVGRGGSFITRVAEVAEISLYKGRVKVHKVWCAVDCGTVINPDLVRAQVEGSVGFAMSALLYGRVSFANGEVEQSNYHDYPMLRLAEMPEVDVALVASEASPSGMGEPAMPPLAPAVCNALAALNGQRIRSLPLSLHGLA